MVKNFNEYYQKNKENWKRYNKKRYQSKKLKIELERLKCSKDQNSVFLGVDSYSEGCYV